MSQTSSVQDKREALTCASCHGSGELPTDNGPVDCPDCGGAGDLPPRNVLVEWRARDIARALNAGSQPRVEDARWLIDELERARTALTEIIALAHDTHDPDEIALRIRFTANRALGLYARRRN
jgi:hypothetical protein